MIPGNFLATHGIPDASKIPPQGAEVFTHVQPAMAGITGTFADKNSRGFLFNGRPVKNEADAYWALQPPAVQQLYFLHTEIERDTLAHELADQGYIIDVPIMVWGWDPLTTMIVRQNQGYTWVPSAKMDPVKSAPGIKFVGIEPYDPSNPPRFSIPVSVDFAKGLEKTDPWLYDPEGNPRF